MNVSIQDNYTFLKKRINQVCERCGRDPEMIKLIWVSKTKSQEKIIEAQKSGALDFGENRVQEVLEKFPLPGNMPDYHLHFIGRLQSNKARKIIPLCHSIHSVDSLKLLTRINRISQEIGVKKDVFLQVNTSGEPSKAGFDPETFQEVLKNIPECSFINFKGLMTIGPYVSDIKIIRRSFKTLARLLKKIKNSYFDKKTQFCNMKYLSMGMSNDFEVAIEEGSHYIRIGTSLFGRRD